MLIFTRNFFFLTNGRGKRTYYSVVGGRPIFNFLKDLKVVFKYKTVDLEKLLKIGAFMIRSSLEFLIYQFSKPLTDSSSGGSVLEDMIKTTPLDK